MNDYERIRRLIALYGQLLDSRRIAEWGQLFTEEAVFQVWGRTYRGRAEIEREIGGMQSGRPGKHISLQPVIDLDDERHARAWVDFAAATTHEDDSISVVTLGRYHDRLERGDDDRWRLRERVIVMGGEEVPEGVDPTPPV